MLLLAGAVLAAYVGLCLLAEPARADAGGGLTEAVAQVDTRAAAREVSEVVTGRTEESAAAAPAPAEPPDRPQSESPDRPQSESPVESPPTPRAVAEPEAAVEPAVKAPVDAAVESAADPVGQLAPAIEPAVAATAPLAEPVRAAVAPVAEVGAEATEPVKAVVEAVPPVPDVVPDLPPDILPALPPGLPELPPASVGPDLELPGLELPGIELPGLQLPSIELPGLQLPGPGSPGGEPPGAGLPDALTSGPVAVLPGPGRDPDAGRVAARSGQPPGLPRRVAEPALPAEPGVGWRASTFAGCGVGDRMTSQPQTSAAGEPAPTGRSGSSPRRASHGFFCGGQAGGLAGDAGQSWTSLVSTPADPPPATGTVAVSAGLDPPTRTVPVAAPSG